MSIVSLRRQLVYALLLFGLLLVLVPRAGLQYDVDFWLNWAIHIHEHGLSNTYLEHSNTYNPIFQYILWLYDQLAGNPEKIRRYIHLVKAAILFFDFAGAFWAASLVPDRTRRFGLVLLLLFNIGYLYDTLIWVQVDGLYAFFAFGSVVLAAQRRGVLSVLCYVLALATKTQAIMFLPPLLLLWLPQWWRHPRQLVQALLAGAALATLVLAPFIWGGWENTLPRIIEFNRQVDGVFPHVSQHAHNLWLLLFPTDAPLDTMSDQIVYAGLTYHAWGLLLFCTASAIALLPLLVAGWYTVRRHWDGPNLALALLSGGSIPLLFTFFNTQMHERYWHGAIIFLAAYGFQRRHYLPYVLVSVAYFLNLETTLRYLDLDNYHVLLLHPRFIAALFALAVVVVLVRLYQLAPWRTKLPIAAQAVVARSVVAD